MKAVQNFYKSTITQDWSIGTGIFYVSVKPTVSEGWLVVSPNNASLREVIYYNGTGTDGNGDYITVTQRGVGTTDEQTHTIGEPIRMNIDENYWDYLTDSIEAIVAAGTPDADTSTAGKVEIATDAQVIAGTETGETGAKLVITPKSFKTRLDSMSSGVTTKNLSESSNTQNIAHGLNRIPKKINLKGLFTYYNNYNYINISEGCLTDSGNSCIFSSSKCTDSSFMSGNSSTYGIVFMPSASETVKQEGIITVDETNIIITWTKTGSPTGIGQILWEAE